MKRWTSGAAGLAAAACIAPLLVLFTLHCQDQAAPAPPPPIASVPVPGAAAPPTPEARVEDLLRQMTLDEKIDYLGGERSMFIRGIPRLGIPEIKMSDGPAGCRNWGPSTAYVAPVGLAAAFDEKLAERVGASIGRDCRARNVHILLAPGMNIARTPLGGRNFEYLGEDPFLAGTIAAAYIRGVQSSGVLATAKHYVANDQEWDRTHISSEVDQRALHEIYLAPFERAVKEGHVASVMTAYNLLNGTYCSHSKYLIRDVLEKEWGFTGFVMSDWGAVKDTMGAIEGGLDLEMPSGKYIDRENVEPLLKAGKIDAAAIDGRIRRILVTLVRAGFLDHAQASDAPLDDLRSPVIALDEARASLVLLKNAKGLLPLDRKAIKRIAVIGPNADPAVVGGYGSAWVTPFRAISVLAGIKEGAPSASVDYHVGVHQTSEYALLGRPVFDGPVEQAVFRGRELEGAPISTTQVDRIDYRPEGDHPKPPVAGAPSENFSVRWKGQVTISAAGAYRLAANTDDGARVFVDGKKVIDDWSTHATKTNLVSLPLSQGKHDVVVEYFQGTGGAVAQFGMGPDVPSKAHEGAAEVTALARRADVVIVALGFSQGKETNSVSTAFPGLWPPAWAREKGLVEAEDSDRPFELPETEIETVKLAAAANPRTIVVMNAGGGVDMSKFLDKVAALLWAWYPGQEGGRAIAEILFGDTNPSGKLPVTFGKRYEDYPSARYYKVNDGGKTPYTEGIFVGYRGFQENGVEPLFPFGYGMSYTRFEYAITSAKALPSGGAVVQATVKNVGRRDGDEIVQFYVGAPKGGVPRPPRQLEAYRRVSLKAGESAALEVELEPRAFAYWAEGASPPGWSVDDGTYDILMGASSADIRAKAGVEIHARRLP
jgi:beta-glucosidase